MRKISVWKVLCLCGGLCVAAPVWAQDAATAPDLSVPDVDVADSVRRMLEAARVQQGQDATEGGVEAGADGAKAVPAPGPAAAPVPVPVAPPPAAAGSAPAPVAAPAPAPVAAPAPAPVAAPAPAPVAAPAPRPAPAPSNHVPLPEREFTIRSVDDIRELARELEEAKQRQRR